jgi:catechol 2,3-dioxygenase-like lactoylglutathione lyase family enzyme
MGDIVKRTTVIVRDADRAAHWYAEVFGMTRWMDAPFTLSGAMLPAGQAGDRTRLVVMRAEHDAIGMIGLLQWVDPPLPPPATVPTRVGYGAPIFVVQSDDTRAAVERARALGSRIHCEPHEWQVTGVEGRVKNLLGASFFDLDGYFFEVNQTVRARD